MSGFRDSPAFAPLLAVAALLCACELPPAGFLPAADGALPIVEGPVLVSDAGHGSPNAQYQTTPCQRVGARLYCVYLVATSPSDPTDADLAAQYYVRAIDLGAMRAVGPARRVLAVEQDTLEGPVHSNPALARDALGSLVVVTNYFDRRDAAHPRHAGDDCGGRRCWGSRVRVIPQLEEPDGWGSEGSLPARVANAPGGPRCSFCAGAQDWTWLYDERAACSYGVAESFHAEQVLLDGRRPNAGLGRLFYRLCGDARAPASFDGPYLAVDTGRWPGSLLGYPPARAEGNVFTKGYLRLGREHSGPRSLHLVWTNHNTFTIENRPGDPDCGSPGSDDDNVRWDFDLHYARSRDGGRSWETFDGRAQEASVQWNDERYRIWSGETEETVGYSWDLDPAGAPVIALRVPKGGAFKGDPGDPSRWHMDQDPCDGARGDPAPTYDLELLRYDAEAAAFVATPVERDFRSGRLGLHVAAGGEVYLLREAPPRYSVSADGGSWSRWTRFDDFDCRDYADPWSHCDSGWRLAVLPDYEDPRFVHVLFQSTGPLRNASTRDVVDVGGRYHYVRLQTSR